jgi:TPP-dependent pyruvate/acetoin dehydrogenase alpha subunit
MAAASSNSYSKIPYAKIHDLMVKSRALEERLIKIYKSGEGFFWIGGPGQEAFDIPLGMQIKKGQGLDFDWFHGHYRSTPVLVAMGLEMIEGVRMMKNLAPTLQAMGAISAITMRSPSGTSHPSLRPLKHNIFKPSAPLGRRNEKKPKASQS